MPERTVEREGVANPSSKQSKEEVNEPVHPVLERSLPEDMVMPGSLTTVNETARSVIERITQIRRDIESHTPQRRWYDTKGISELGGVPPIGPSPSQEETP